MIEELVPSRGAFFTGHDLVESRPTFRLSSDGLSDTEDGYSLEMYRSNDRVNRLLTHPAGSVIRGSELTPNDDFEKSKFYTRFMKKHDLFHTGGAILENNFLKALTFGAIREKSAGEFTDGEMQCFAILSRHAHRALKIREVVEDRDASYRVRDNVADRIAAGMFTLDGDGRVLMTNAEADGLLSDGDGISVTNGRLTFSANVANGHLRDIVDSHAVNSTSSESPELPSMFGANRPSGGTPYWVTWMPATDTRSLLTAHISGLPQPRFLVFVSDSARRWVVSADALRAHYGLTRREAEPVAELVAGATAEEICESYEISPNTVKTHLKRIFEKTSVSGQVELVRTVIRAHGATV